jgi:hypothetical protein
MSLDRRLREGLERVTSGIDPDVDWHLHQAVRGARRRVALRRAGAALAAAAAIITGVVLGPRALDALWNSTGQPSAGQPAPTVNEPTTVGNQAIAGTYRRTVSLGNLDAQNNRLAGRWRIELRPDGTMAVRAPAAFTGVLSGSQFQVQADSFRTTLFIQDLCANLPVPTYRWTRVGDRLRFTPVDDRCRARVAVLASGPWTTGG